jgi:predicted nuclease of predicted toxin-antitoxin system
VIKFHLDEHVDPAVADGLRRRGIDVTTTAEAGLSGAEDPSQIAFAHAADRVLGTHDDDFLRIHQRGEPHAGIVYGHQHARSIGEVIRGLVLIQQCLTVDEMRGMLEYL